MLLLIIELVQRTPELASNFIFIRCRSHPFNLIHWLYGDSRAHVSRILIASPAMQITRVSVVAGVGRGGGGGKGEGGTKKRAILRSMSFPFSRAFSRPARPLGPSYRAAIRTRYNAINIPRRYANSVAEQRRPSPCSLSTPRATTMPGNCTHARSRNEREREERGRRSPGVWSTVSPSRTDAVEQRVATRGSCLRLNVTARLNHRARVPFINVINRSYRSNVGCKMHPSPFLASLFPF